MIALLQKIKACHAAFWRPAAFTFIISGKKHFHFFFFFPNIILHRKLCRDVLFSWKNPAFSDFFSLLTKDDLLPKMPFCAYVPCSV